MMESERFSQWFFSQLVSLFTDWDDVCLLRVRQRSRGQSWVSSRYDLGDPRRSHCGNNGQIRSYYTSTPGGEYPGGETIPSPLQLASRSWPIRHRPATDHAQQAQALNPEQSRVPCGEAPPLSSPPSLPFPNPMSLHFGVKGERPGWISPVPRLRIVYDGDTNAQIGGQGWGFGYVPAGPRQLSGGGGLNARSTQLATYPGRSALVSSSPRNWFAREDRLPSPPLSAGPSFARKAFSGNNRTATANYSSAGLPPPVAGGGRPGLGGNESLLRTI